MVRAQCLGARAQYPETLQGALSTLLRGRFCQRRLGNWRDNGRRRVLLHAKFLLPQPRLDETAQHLAMIRLAYGDDQNSSQEEHDAPSALLPRAASGPMREGPRDTAHLRPQRRAPSPGGLCIVAIDIGYDDADATSPFPGLQTRARLHGRAPARRSARRREGRSDASRPSPLAQADTLLQPLWLRRLFRSPSFSLCGESRDRQGGAMVKYSSAAADPQKAAKARGSDLRVHFKNTRETAFAIKGKTLTKAKQYLEAVQRYERAIPFHRFTGGVGRSAQAKNEGSTTDQGRWPQKSVEFILGLLKNAESNAEVLTAAWESARV